MEQTNSSALYKIVSENIFASKQSRISFAEYQNIVLYNPDYGYYGSGNVDIGSKGDFFTSSSLGADFGHLLAVQLEELWNKLEKPKNFSIVEMGAGNGNLANDILGYWKETNHEILPNLNYIIIEKSLPLISQQQKRLNEFNDLNITWKDWADIPDSSIIGCCFSNELFDAFPVHRITVQGDQIQEIYLTIKDGQIQEIIDDPSTAEINDYFQLIGIEFNNQDYPQDYRTEINLAAINYLKTINCKLRQGYILTIDYGYPAPKYYHPQRSQGTLQCYYQHRRHNNPYLNLGYQDITTHIDFTALENLGIKQGWSSIGFTKQALWLMGLGLGDKLSELSSGKYNAMEVIKKRDALHQLINPMGLGGFGVLIQGKELTGEQLHLKSLEIPSEII